MILDPLLHTHKLTLLASGFATDYRYNVLCICRCKLYQGGIPEIEHVVHNQFHRGQDMSYPLANHHFWHEMNDQNYRFVVRMKMLLLST